MKKITTIITSILFSISVIAQIIPGQNHKNLIKAIDDQIILKGDEVLSNLMVNPNPSTFAVINENFNSKNTITEEIIGYTTYDLQSNGSVQNRIVVHDDGTISAGWTMSWKH